VHSLSESCSAGGESCRCSPATVTVTRTLRWRSRPLTDQASVIWTIAIVVVIVANTYNILLLCTIRPIYTLCTIWTDSIATYIVSNNVCNTMYNIFLKYASNHIVQDLYILHKVTITCTTVTIVHLCPISYNIISNSGQYHSLYQDWFNAVQYC
jgi:hypothetical protein